MFHYIYQQRYIEPNDRHRTYLSQRLQLLQLFVVVVRILSIIFQDELEGKKQGRQADNLYISRFHF